MSDLKKTAPPYSILYVHNSADYYGASRSLLRLLETQNKNVFTSFVVLPKEGPLSENFRALGATVFILPELTIISRYVHGPKDFFRQLVNVPCSIFALYRLIKKNRILLVHTNVGVIPVAAAASFLARVPHVWHVREFFAEFKKLWFFYRKYMSLTSERIIPVSEATATQFPQRKKLTVIYNGFDINDVTDVGPRLSSKKNISVIHDGFHIDDFAIDHSALQKQFYSHYQLSAAFTVGCVGRIKFQRKGQDVFIEAISLLKKRGFPIRGLIVGAPFSANEKQWQMIKDLIAQLDVKEEIILTGEMTDVRPAYAAMDVFVLPSAQPEPFGGVVMEAMGMKLPVIATSIGGSPEQVEEGVTGYLVPPNDASAIADRIIRFYENPELRTRFGHAGFERLKTEFALKEKTKLLEKLYLEILEK